MTAPGTTNRIVILGGTGVFGSRLARMLLTDGWDVLITSRTGAGGHAFTQEFGGQAEVWSRGAPLGKILNNAFLVVDAVGPFQNYDSDSYAVAHAAIRAGAHYFDLSDDDKFTSGINALHRDAVRAGVTLFSGMSSVPALSSAVVTALSKDIKGIKTIEIAILPGNRAPRGGSVMRAILGQVGAPLCIWRNGKWAKARGWSEAKTYALAPDLKRKAALIGAPDLALFPDYYKADNVEFRAGLELGIMQFSLGVMSWLRAHGLGPNPALLTGPLHWLASRLEGFGTDRGGMVAQVTSKSGETQCWTLLAEAGDGPFIPAIPAIIAAGKLRSGAYQPGAGAALDVFTLAEAETELGRLNTTMSRE